MLFARQPEGNARIDVKTAVILAILFASALVFPGLPYSEQRAGGSTPEDHKTVLPQETGKYDTDNPFLLYGPFTTSQGDALTEVPFLDDFNSDLVLPMSLLPRGQEGGFRLALDGVFEYRFQSYCMDPTLPAPPPDAGLLYAPLRGPAADIFQKIVRGAIRNPDISHRKVQKLIRMIIDREGRKKLDFQRPAERLLSSEDRQRLADIRHSQQVRLKELESGSRWRKWKRENWRLLWDWRQAEEQELTRVEAPMEVIEKQREQHDADSNRFREQLGVAQETADASTLEELERVRMDLETQRHELDRHARQIGQEQQKIKGAWKQRRVDAFSAAAGGLSVGERAYLLGRPPSREIPKGRWSYHLDGFFLRYFASGDHRWTQAQIAVPACIPVERDARGRILAVGHPYWDRVETLYDDEAKVAVDGDPGVEGHAFHSIRFLRESGGPPEEVHWVDLGWSLIGVPSGEADIAEEPERFPGLAERYRWAVAHLEEVRRLDQGLATLLRRVGRSPEAETKQEERPCIRDLIDLASYAQALQVAIDGRSDAPAWVAEHLNLLREAWMWSYSKYSDAARIPDCRVSCPHSKIPGHPHIPQPPPVPPSPPTKHRSSPNQELFHPSEGVAMPGYHGYQPLLLAGAGDKKKKRADGDLDEVDEACRTITFHLVAQVLILKAFEDKGLYNAAKHMGEGWDFYQQTVINLAQTAFDAEQWTSFDALSDAEKAGLFQSSTGRARGESLMFVDCNCDIQENWNLDKFQKEDKKRAGNALYRAAREHEKVHQSTCRSMTPTWFCSPGRNIRSLRIDEIKAYNAGIDEKVKSLKKLRCK